MKIKIVAPEIKSDNKLCVAFDVGKRFLDSYSPFSNGPLQMIMNDRIKNMSNTVRGALLEYRKLALENGLDGVHIVCEPTGGYERTLLRIAHELGMTTAYVNGESVSKLRVVRQNDTGKTDQLDPRIIHLAASQGRQLRIRQLKDGYAELRELNVCYDQVSDQVSTMKNYIHDTVYRIFPDLRMRNYKLFGPCGSALVEGFGADPVLIARLGFEQFIGKMKRYAPRLRRTTLKEIYSQASINAMHLVSTTVRQVLGDHLRHLYTTWRRLEDRKEQLKKQISQIYLGLPEARRLNVPGVSDFMMGRVIGETGPLSDYASHRRLLRMAGLNLRQKSSGKYKGKDKISKKGRARLRKILYQVVMLFLIKPGRIYSMEYARKKIDGAANIITIVALMRKFIRALFGLHCSAMPFDMQRFTTSESQFKAA